MRDRIRRLPDAAPAWAHDAWARLHLWDRGAQLAVLAGLALVVAGVAVFVAVLDSVQEMDDIAALDEPLLTGLYDVRSDPVTLVLNAITTITGPVVLPVIVVVACAVWGFVAKQWWQAGLLAGAMIVSTAVSSGLKAVIARPRPPVDIMFVPGYETTYSFPSGHTIGTGTLLLVAGYLVWIRRPRVRSLVWWLLAIAAGTFLVALSRLYLGYHFLTDVTASMGLAVAVLGCVVVVDRRRAARAARVTAGEPAGPSTD